MKTSRLAATITGLGMLCLSSLVLARGPADKLTEALDLDEQQAATISTLFEEHRDYMQNEIEWRDADGNRIPEAREKARSAREALHQEILAVLDEEQAARFEQMKERKEHRHARDRHHNRYHNRRGNRMAYALGQLDLSDQQEEAIQALMAEQKSERGHQREQFRTQLESILTEAQLAKLDAMREEHRGRRNR